MCSVQVGIPSHINSHHIIIRDLWRHRREQIVLLKRYANPISLPLFLPQQITDNLIKNGSELEALPHTDHPTIHWLMGKIKQLMTDFDDRLAKRKKKLDESVRLHRLIESVSEYGSICVCF